ncbi:MAG TPA: ATP-grasp fold amidoligase family protein [Candidatus Saccharicenans sp.]|nr:ATP-grasp fold amidoligase family protein [Candidatus Saccharicenans sp.]
MNLVKSSKEKLLKSLFKFFSLMCRTSSLVTGKGNKPANQLTSFLAGLVFLIVHGYVPRFRQPRSFSEKIFNRMLFSRNRKWIVISDKLQLRECIRQRIGNTFLMELIWSGSNPEDIPFEMLPQRYVIKMNHGCGYNILIDGKTSMSLNEIKLKLNRWKLENYCQDKNQGLEWAYKNIKPMIMIEEFLEENGRPPLDYKFFCFSGRVEYLQISFDRFGDASERILDRNFNVLDTYNGVRLCDGPIKRPENYDEMIKVAEKLSAGFDFIRVDLYNVDGKIYFGELTCYPAGGLAAFVPRKWDFIFGEKWILENKYK